MRMRLCASVRNSPGEKRSRNARLPLDAHVFYFSFASLLRLASTAASSTFLFAARWSLGLPGLFSVLQASPNGCLVSGILLRLLSSSDKDGSFSLVTAPRLAR